MLEQIFSYDITTGTETDVHDFGKGTDGKVPYSSLIQVNDSLLYGMTYDGGLNDTSQSGDGIIFSYNIFTGAELDLHDFGKGSDGKHPHGSLLKANNGLLYGMTYNGGVNDTDLSGDGIIFSYDITTGIETVLHNFGSDTDGRNPYGSLIQASNNLLYGMASYGGINDDGTIFSYTISTDTFTVLYEFGSDTDGALPGGSLFQANNGLLYGTTLLGGAYNKGIIFSYDISKNKETHLYDFGGASDGYETSGSFIRASNGLLYAMNSYGGVNNVGTIFSYNISTGSYNVIHDFLGGADGQWPSGDLIEVDSTTGINQLSVNDNQLSIYPNPTSRQFTIKSNGNQNGFTVEVFNVVGEKIYQSFITNPQEVVNLSNQPDGMYFVYVKSDEGVELGKVMIIK